MKTRVLPNPGRILTAITLACLVPGCNKDPEQTSLDTISEKGLSLTPDDYVRTASEGNVDLLKKYHEAGTAVDVADSTGATALSAAARNGRSAAVDYLISSGAQVDLEDAEGRTALMWAASEGQTDAIQSLLKARANPSKRDKQGFSPLTLATYNGKPDAVDILAPVSRAYLDQSLHIASATGNVRVISRLLHHGASVYARSREDKTALMWAAGQGHMDAVNLLLQAGATRQATSGENQTAAELALEAGHQDIHDILIDPNYVPTSVPLEVAGADTPTTGPGETAAGAPITAGEAAEATQGLVSALDQPLTTADSVPTALDAAGESPGQGEGDVSSSTSPQSDRTAGSAGSAPAPIARIHKKILPQPKPQAVATAGPNTSRKVTLPESLVLQRFEEAEMPLRLNEVAGSTATISIRPGEESGATDAVNVAVKAGDEIQGTPYKVVKVTKRMVASKASLGKEVDASEIRLQDTSSGREFRVLKDQVARTDETRAVLRDPGTGQLFDVRNGDEFSSQDGTLYRVRDIRSTAVIVEDMTNGGTHTIDRRTM